MPLWLSCIGAANIDAKVIYERMVTGLKERERNVYELSTNKSVQKRPTQGLRGCIFSEINTDNDYSTWGDLITIANGIVKDECPTHVICAVK